MPTFNYPFVLRPNHAKAVNRAVDLADKGQRIWALSDETPAASEVSRHAAPPRLKFEINLLHVDRLADISEQLFNVANASIENLSR